MLQTATDLVSISWSNVLPAIPAVSTNTALDVFDVSDPARFYRLLLPGAQITAVEPAVLLTNCDSTIYIVGQSFDFGYSAEVNGQSVSNLVVLSPALLQGTLPCLPTGVYDVQVFNVFHQQVAVLSNSVQVVSSLPALSLVEPPERPAAEPSDNSSTGSPVAAPLSLYLFSGEFCHSAVDMRIKGRGLDFIWARKYRSRLGPTNTAMGVDWDFSYNIYIQPPSNGAIVLHDGNTRADSYTLQADGTYTCAGFFRVLTTNSNGAYSLVFPDTSTWNFLPFDAASAPGKIATIQDRNGNTLAFSYDANGRLTNILDTLNRNIVVGYNPDGFIASVTDFTDRQVTYNYSAANDLTSATSPIVTGTPNGNDFPNGKTTAYTYSSGFADPVLNHNLLTITDPKNQTWLTNGYDTTAGDYSYARVTAQAWGYNTNLLEVVYLPLTPAPSNQFAVQKAILNDRVGDVKEFFYDVSNRCVLINEYTGRAVPGQPVTDTANRPVNPLRPSDPALFQTAYSWNSDFLPTQMVYPNGNVGQNFYAPNFNPAAGRLSCGNLRLARRLPGPLGGDQAVLTRQNAFDTDGGGPGFNFIMQTTDARGNTTSYAYDDQGNRTNMIGRIPTIVDNYTYNQFGQLTSHTWPDNGSGSSRLDLFNYYAAPSAQYGYLSNSMVDAAGFALTTTFQPDARGNVMVTIDPRGNPSTNIFNQLDQVVRFVSRPVNLAGNLVSYWTDTYYDSDDNVVQVNTQNLNDQGQAEYPGWLTNTTAYEILNFPIMTSRAVNASHSIERRFAYDANLNQVLAVSGEAVNGDQPNNTIQTLYDERDLVFQSIRAPNDAGHSTLEMDFDGNRNTIRTLQGLEDTGAVRTNLFAYDGYDRRVSSTDPMGNVTTAQYDPNGNILVSAYYGRLTNGSSGGANVLLAQTGYTYDAMDRRVLRTDSIFNASTGQAISPGQAQYQTVYSDNSQVLESIDANQHVTTTAYDTENRVSVVTDAFGDTRTYSYDANNNVILTVEADRSGLGNATQLYRTTHLYDGMDRLTQSEDNAGNINSYTYDSRNNELLFTDARGFETLFQPDGLNRQIGKITGYSLTNAITNSQVWDDNSRLIAQVDAKQNATRYAYDALDRQIATSMADGTLAQTGTGLTADQWLNPQPNLTDFVSGYDVHDNALVTLDANQTELNNSYDLLDRLTSRAITPGSLVAGSTEETYQYDGLSRMVSAQDTFSSVTRGYDSLSRLTEEINNLSPPEFPAASNRAIASTYDAVGNQLSCAYPGGRVVYYTYDPLNRKSSVADTNLLASYYYLGASRVEREVSGNGVTNDYYYDNLRRTTGVIHYTVRGTSNNVLDEHVFGWDPEDNKTNRANVTPGYPGLAFNYASDFANRLTVSAATAAAPAVSNLLNYILDGDNDRIEVMSNAVAENYALPGADAAVDEYSNTPFATSIQYDAEGNLLGSLSGTNPPHAFRYDYRDLMIMAATSGTFATDYTYDVLGRRVQKQTGTNITQYFYDGWQELEEEMGGATAATYVYGNGIDEAITMNRNDTDYYYHADDLGNVTALTDESGAVVERYEYDDFGQLVDTNLNPVAGNPSSVGNPLLFNGRRFDLETGLYYYRTRYLDPEAGRFTTRDSIGVWGDDDNYGNGYNFADSSPGSFTDPFGLGEEEDPIVTDDANRKCRKSEMGRIVLAVEAPRASVFTQLTEKYKQAKDMKPGDEANSFLVVAWAIETQPDVPTTGHTFLAIENAAKERSAWGFYPNNTWFGIKKEDTGTIKDDLGHGATHLIEFKASPETLKIVEDKIKAAQETPPIYNLLDKNCATFAVSTLKEANFTVPSASEPFGFVGRPGMEAWIPAMTKDGNFRTSAGKPEGFWSLTKGRPQKGEGGQGKDRGRGADKAAEGKPRGDRFTPGENKPGPAPANTD
jgi:RHS repeat-associated protein